MTLSARLLIRTFLVCTLLGSGGYVLLYLFRWEWNRAMISGLFFLAAEGALLADGVVARLRRIEDEVRLVGEDRGRVDAASAHLTATRPAAPNRFEWLRPSSGQTSVFVPFLMGAGVLLSAIAWAVERLARMTARPAMERHLARQLSPLMYVAPAGGLVPPPGDGSVGTRRSDPDLAAAGLWATCHLTVPFAEVVEPLAPVARAENDDDEGRYAVTVTPALGENDRRRLRGCLRDGTVDRAWADVVSIG
jgi:hypothetical protein